MKAKIITDKERGRKLYHKVFSEGTGIRKCSALNFENDELKKLTAEVKDLTDVQELCNSTRIQKEIKRLIRLLKYEVPAVSDRQLEVEINCGNLNIDLARYVIEVYCDRESSPPP